MSKTSLPEETAEIRLAHPNLVRFEARRAQNAFPAVEIRDLLKAALRHRPDRIMLGEIRGGEAFDLLQLNTGHSGALFTIHANSAKQALARFVSCVLQGDIDLPYRAIKNQHRRFAQCLRPHRTPPRTPIHQTEPIASRPREGIALKSIKSSPGTTAKSPAKTISASSWFWFKIMKRCSWL
jgi:Type II/IV secretion system protein